jgi:aquaporin Z
MSGMSMNPARTLGSAIFPHLWNSLWIYFTAPAVGMLLAAEVFSLFKDQVFCAKYHHQNSYRCIFCEYQARRKTPKEASELQPSIEPRNSDQMIRGPNVKAGI